MPCRNEILKILEENKWLWQRENFRFRNIFLKVGLQANIFCNTSLVKSRYTFFFNPENV